MSNSFIILRIFTKQAKGQHMAIFKIPGKAELTKQSIKKQKAVMFSIINNVA